MTDEPASTSVRRSTAVRPSDGELLDAACVVFSRAGFHTASMEQIAEAASSTKPTLYAHFGSKNALYVACLTREADAVAKCLFDAYQQAAGLPLDQQVQQDMAAFFDYAANHPDGFRLLFGPEQTRQSSEASKNLLDAIRLQVARRINGYGDEHQLTINAEIAHMYAALLVGIAVHGAQHAVLDHHIDPAVASQLATGFAVAALSHVGPSAKP